MHVDTCFDRVTADIQNRRSCHDDDSVIYRKIVDAKLDPTQLIYVSPPCRSLKQIALTKAVIKLDTTLWMERDRCLWQAFEERSKLSPYH